MFEFLLAAVSQATPSLDLNLATIWQDILRDFSNITQPSELEAFLKILAIDLLLAGDNAIIIGALAAGLPPEQRRKVILIGIAAALLLRIGFALITTWLMGIVGLIFAGGLLLLWVAWKMYREIGTHGGESGGSPEVEGDESSGLRPAKSFLGAAWAVAVADVSMSLDNVLAVAGAAREHPGILVVGLFLSVALMGVASNVLAKYIERYRWIAYIGLALILWVAGEMIWVGWTGDEQTIGLESLIR
jgi:YjbE family integral membrane protein